MSYPVGIRDVRRASSKGQSYRLFSTALGVAGVAWSHRGLIGVELPNASVGKPSERLRAAAGCDTPSAEPPPPWVEDAIARLTRYFDGEPEDLSGIPLDMESAPPFHRKVYEVTRRIGRGEVLTYGEIAALSGSPGASRAVGQAMSKNPMPILIPCHRVVGSGGKPGGFSAPGGLVTKARLLALEGAKLML
jgi:methylated-DNA-[protein]-cysteine S-methyltransferase